MMSEICTVLEGLGRDLDRYQIPGDTRAYTYEHLERLYPIVERVFEQYASSDQCDEKRNFWKIKRDSIQFILTGGAHQNTRPLYVKGFTRKLEAIQKYSLDQLLEKYKDECSSLSGNSLSEVDRIELESIAQYLMDYYRDEADRLEKDREFQKQYDVEYPKWAQRYQEAFDRASQEEKDAISQYDLSQLESLSLESLQKEYITLSKKCISKSSDLSKESSLFSMRVHMGVIAHCLKQYYEIRREQLSRYNADLEAHSKWVDVFISIKGYRKEKLKETPRLGRVIRGVRNKEKVKRQARDFKDVPLCEILARGDELAQRWQVQLAREKEMDATAVRNIRMVPFTVLSQLYGCMEERDVNKRIYPLMTEIARENRAAFMPFSPLISRPEQGLVGVDVKGRWIVVEPIDSSALPKDKVVANDSIIRGFFIGQDHLANGVTAWVIFRDAQIHREDGSLHSQQVAIKGFRDAVHLNDATPSDDAVSSIGLPEREWAAMQKVQGIEDVIQGLGVLINPVDHHVQAIVLPRFRNHLGECMEFLVTSQSSTQERQQILFSIFFRIATAITKLHKMDLYHNDLKPENILVNYDVKDGKVVVAEMAITDLSNLLAEDREVLPSVGYYFPEEFELLSGTLASASDKKHIRILGDIRALGVMMHNAFASTPYPKLANGHLDLSKGCQEFQEGVPEKIQDYIRCMLSTEKRQGVPVMALVARVLEKHI